MALPAGKRLGAYEILAPLGEGGMGEVYRARDPRLDRDVAIKVLAAGLAHDPTALARFEREATSVAKLSHPNILSIFEFAREGDTAFVVMELVEGETLRARLERGPLSVRHAAGYALQIAKGIAAAHVRGIVHRDLKPENVMIANDDQVKILDFGLAKPIDPAGSDATRGPSLATSVGTVLGTYGYMAPEQVRGLPVDHRADMFAFGAVLFEMLSGRRAFQRETAADTMSAVLTGEPPEIDATTTVIPPGLDRIVRRCLEKSPELRFQSANDLAFALETLSSISSDVRPGSGVSQAASLAPAVPSKARFPWLPWTIAAAASVAAVAIWLTRGTPPVTEPPWSHFTRITEAAGEETSPSLSPDGTTIVYAMRVNGSWGIFSQRVGGRNATAVVDDPKRDERAPTFSPDGSLIAFHVASGEGGIFVAGATGESVRRVTEFGFDPAWSPDGKSIAFATEEVSDPASRSAESVIYIVDAAGGTPRKVVEKDAVQPSWSPKGDRLVYWSNTNGQRDLYTISTSGGTRVPITQDASIDWCPVWSRDGRFIYFSSDRGGEMNLWRIGVDVASGQPTGQPEPVVTGVQASAGLPSFSKDGTRLAFRSRVASTNPVAMPFDPVTLRTGTPVLLDTQNNIRVPSDVSPDGSLVAYHSIGERQEDLYIGSVHGGPIRRVTDDAPRDRIPVFTPDGKSLLFYSTRGGSWAIWSVGVDGGNLHKIASPDNAFYPLSSPKGDSVVFGLATGGGLFEVANAPGASPRELPGSNMAGKLFFPTSWSADGRRVAGAVSSVSGRPAGIGVYDFAAKSMEIVSNDDSSVVHWLTDGRRLLYFAGEGAQLVVLDTITHVRQVVAVRLPTPAATDGFALAPDDKTIIYAAPRAEADIWIVERK